VAAAQSALFRPGLCRLASAARGGDHRLCPPGPRSLLATNRVTEFTGAIAYVFILAMAATSFGASAAWIGRRAWTILHTVGSYYIWISFAIAFGKRSLQGPVYPAAVCLLVVALGLRYGAALQRARRERSRGALG
jgi:DMSO/TMAO reductase YedYZ heme-binding membrane subunit